MDLVVEIWKTLSRKSGVSFSTIPATEKDWVIDNWKNARLQRGAGFPTYQQPDNDKFLIYEIEQKKENTYYFWPSAEGTALHRSRCYHRLFLYYFCHIYFSPDRFDFKYIKTTGYPV